MSRVIFGLVALIATILITNINAQDDRCGPNEVWNSCGSPCTPTCENPRTGGACAAVCAPGCYCTRGWTRSKEGGPCVQKCR